MFSIKYATSGTIEKYGYVGVQQLPFGGTPIAANGTFPVSSPMDTLTGGIYRFNLYGFWEINAGLSLVKRYHGTQTEISCWGWFDEEEPFLGLQQVSIADAEDTNQKLASMSYHHKFYATEDMVDGDSEFSLVFGPTSGDVGGGDVHVSYLGGYNWVEFTYLGDA
jgi:hypothetical protein